MRVGLKGSRFCLEVFDDALDLPVDILHRWRQKTFKPVSAALVQAERRSFVKNGVVQQRDTMQGIVRLGLGDLHHTISPLFQWLDFSGLDRRLLAQLAGRKAS